MYINYNTVKNQQNLSGKGVMSKSETEDFTPAMIEMDVNQYLKNLFLKPGEKIHTKLQNFLFYLAAKYNCVGLKEYPVVTFKKSGLIDVLWKKNNRNFLAIEIDFANRVKSIEKLLAIKAEHRIWVYLSWKSPMGNLRKLDPQGKIIFIKPVKLKGQFPFIKT